MAPPQLGDLLVERLQLRVELRVVAPHRLLLLGAVHVLRQQRRASPRASSRSSASNAAAARRTPPRARPRRGRSLALAALKIEVREGCLHRHYRDQTCGARAWPRRALASRRRTCGYPRRAARVGARHPAPRRAALPLRAELRDAGATRAPTAHHPASPPPQKPARGNSCSTAPTPRPAGRVGRAAALTFATDSVEEMLANWAAHLRRLRLPAGRGDGRRRARRVPAARRPTSRPSTRRRRARCAPRQRLGGDTVNIRGNPGLFNSLGGRKVAAILDLLRVGPRGARLRR